MVLGSPAHSAAAGGTAIALSWALLAEVTSVTHQVVECGRAHLVRLILASGKEIIVVTVHNFELLARTTEFLAALVRLAAGRRAGAKRTHLIDPRWGLELPQRRRLADAAGRRRQDRGARATTAAELSSRIGPHA